MRGPRPLWQAVTDGPEERASGSDRRVRRFSWPTDPPGTVSCAVIRPVHGGRRQRRVVVTDVERHPAAGKGEESVAGEAEGQHVSGGFQGR